MRTHAWKAMLPFGAVGAAVLLVFPDAVVPRAVFWSVAMLLALATVATGIRLHRPRQAGPWLLLALSFAAFTCASVITLLSPGVTTGALDNVALDLLNLAGFLLLGIAAGRLIRYQAPEGDRDGLIDATIVTVAVTTVLWSITFSGIDEASVSLLTRAAHAVALIVPAWVTAVCVRLVLTAGTRSASARFIGAAGVSLFIATLLWTLEGTRVAGATDAVAELLWLVAILAAPTGALHPSMRQLAEPSEDIEESVGRGRLAVLGLALLATPAAILYAAGSVQVNIVLPIGGSALLAVLVLLRLARLVHDRESARREVATRAVHQAALSRLAADALDNLDVVDLYREAEAILRPALDATSVTVRTDVDASCGAGGDHLGARSRPINGLDGPVAAIEFVTGPRRELSDEEQQFLGAVVDVVSSAVQRRQAEDELAKRALHDPLTGLPNRTQLFERLGHVLLRRAGSPVGVLFIDLDGFKQVNDTYGHEIGDRVLVRIAGRAREAVRAGDTVARLAGDEFVALLDPCDDHQLPIIARRLLDAILAPMEVDGVRLHLGASVGGLLTRPDDRDPEQVLRRADEAMYCAKHERGGGIVLAGAP